MEYSFQSSLHWLAGKSAMLCYANPIDWEREKSHHRRSDVIERFERFDLKRFERIDGNRLEQNAAGLTAVLECY